MIKSITVTNHLGESLVLTLADPDSSGLAVMSITGLGEPDAEINLTNMAGSDYASYNSARNVKRNVVLDLRYWGDDIEESRHTAYKFFSTKQKVKLVFHTTHRDSELTGYVEKNTPKIFDKESGCQISIICPDPFLYSQGQVTNTFGGIDPLFKFPFSDSNPDEIQFGLYRIVKDQSIYYTGEAETGITINFHATGRIRGFMLYNLSTGEQMGINDTILAEIAGESIKAGDNIIISTVKGQKSVELVREGQTYDIINALDRTKTNPDGSLRRPDWFELSQGDNLFTFTAEEGEYSVMLYIRHRILYKGV